MADLRRQLERSRQREAQLRQELLNLQRVVGWIDPAYAAALCDHQALALGSIRREAAGPITGGTSGRPPNYEARAYDDLRKQRLWQRKQAAYLRRRLRWIVDRDADPDDERRTPHAVLFRETEETA